MASDRMLAVFVDRQSMRHERWYAHDISLVWEVVTTDDHLDVWLLPVSTVERHRGGRCSFSWGGPAERSIVGEVSLWDPPRTVQYTFEEPGSFLRFDLEEVSGGTRMVFTQSFESGQGTGGDPDEFPGADLPAGPDTPWKPGFVAGFHEMLDDLSDYLRGEFTAADRSRHLAGTDAAMVQRHNQWIDIYRQHIANSFPRP